MAVKTARKGVRKERRAKPEDLAGWPLRIIRAIGVRGGVATVEQIGRVTGVQPSLKRMGIMETMDFVREGADGYRLTDDGKKAWEGITRGMLGRVARGYRA